MKPAGTLSEIIYSKHPDNSPEIVVLVDAEKAFDRVEWGYLFAVLKNFGFGDKYISWMRLLYISPHASVHTNNVSSDNFVVEHGTRQGCPFSPSLFVLANKPRDISIRSSTSRKGVIRKGTEYLFILVCK